MLKNFILSCMLALSMTNLAAAESPVPKYRLLLQVSEDSVEQLNLALSNAKHVQESVGRQNVDVEIVAYGPGVQTLKYYTPIAFKVAEARLSGVRIVACENSMRSSKLRTKDMVTTISYVPSGVTELLIKQTQGWSYVRS